LGRTIVVRVVTRMVVMEFPEFITRATKEISIFWSWACLILVFGMYGILSANQRHLVHCRKGYIKSGEAPLERVCVW